MGLDSNYVTVKMEYPTLDIYADEVEKIAKERNFTVDRADLERFYTASYAPASAVYELQNPPDWPRLGENLNAWDKIEALKNFYYANLARPDTKGVDGAIVSALIELQNCFDKNARRDRDAKKPSAHGRVVVIQGNNAGSVIITGDNNL